MKACGACGAEFARRPRESTSEWAARRLCSRGCTPSLRERLWTRVRQTDGETSCWPWEGGKTSTGHGTIKVDGRDRGVHVVVWELLRGAIPPGLEVHHRCEFKACCNVAHMELLTKAEHTRLTDGGAHNRRKTQCKMGHPLSGENLYVTPAGGRSCRICLRAADQRRRERNRAKRAA